MTPTEQEPWETEVRERWRTALEVYLARRERTAKLRSELAAARAAGKQIRHNRRLKRRESHEQAPEHGQEEPRRRPVPR